VLADKLVDDNLHDPHNPFADPEYDVEDDFRDLTLEQNVM